MILISNFQSQNRIILVEMLISSSHKKSSKNKKGKYVPVVAINEDIEI